MIQLQLDCIPISWSAPIKGKHGFYDKKSQEKEFIRWQLKGQYRDAPLTGPLAIEFIFFIPIPKSTSRAKRQQMLERRILPTTPDTTNVQKLFEDCLQGIVIDNDRYVNRITSTRYYSEKPGVVAIVKTWQEEMEKQHQVDRALDFEKNFYTKGCI